MSEASFIISTQCFHPTKGGIENLMYNLALSLGKAGRKVHVFADADAPDNLIEMEKASVSVKRFSGFKPLRRWLKAHSVGRKMRILPTPVIICDSWKSLELLNRRNTPSIVFVHGTELPVSPNAKKASRITEAFAKASLVLANSDYTLEAARPYLPPDTPVKVFTPPVEAPLTDIFSEERDWREQLGPGPILLGLGRLEPRKGFDMALKALARLKPRYPNLVFALAGGGEDRSRLEALAEELGVREAFHPLGVISGKKKAALLSIADLMVMPSRRVGNSVEGFGMVYVEAASYGTPSIAGLEGGESSAVLHEKTGLLVDSRSEDTIADAIESFLKDTSKLADFSEAARQHAATQLWQIKAASFITLADTLAAQTPTEPH